MRVSLPEITPDLLALIIWKIGTYWCTFNVLILSGASLLAVSRALASVFKLKPCLGSIEPARSTGHRLPYLFHFEPTMSARYHVMDHKSRVTSTSSPFQKAEASAL